MENRKLNICMADDDSFLCNVSLQSQDLCNFQQVFFTFEVFSTTDNVFRLVNSTLSAQYFKSFQSNEFLMSRPFGFRKIFLEVFRECIWYPSSSCKCSMHKNFSKLVLTVWSIHVSTYTCCKIVFSLSHRQKWTEQMNVFNKGKLLPLQIFADNVEL